MNCSCPIIFWATSHEICRQVLTGVTWTLEKNKKPTSAYLTIRSISNRFPSFHKI